MRSALFVLVAALGGAACGPPLPPPCCAKTLISRNVSYSGTIPLPDGGTPTQVSVVVSGTNTTVTYVNGGRTIVQRFDTTSLVP